MGERSERALWKKTKKNYFYAESKTLNKPPPRRSLRNELRYDESTRPKNRSQLIEEWMEFTPKAIKTINQANPDALIFVGGERAKRASFEEVEHTRDESTPAKWLQTLRLHPLLN